MNKKISTPISIGITLVLAVIIGGYAWWEYGKMWREISELPYVELTKKEKIEVNNRVLITEENISEVFSKELEVCEQKGSCGFYNVDSPITEVLFSNKEKGISLKIPYNPNWGNERYKISPYFSYEDRLEFGPLIVHPYSAGWMRRYTLYYRPLRSAEEVVVSLEEKEKSKGEIGVSEYRIIKDKINDNFIVFVVRDNYIPDIDHPIIEIIGKKYNYQLYPCYYPDLCKDIVKTFELID